MSSYKLNVNLYYQSLYVSHPRTVVRIPFPLWLYIVTRTQLTLVVLCLFCIILSLCVLVHFWLCCLRLLFLEYNWLGIASSKLLISARYNIYISRLCYDISVRLSVCLSVTEVHRRIIANLDFKFWSQFTAHCGRSACGREWEGSSPGRVEGASHVMLAALVFVSSCMLSLNSVNILLYPVLLLLVISSGRVACKDLYVYFTLL